jgi:hypothetical protein
LNDYIWLDNKIYSFIDRKCLEIKQGFSPTRSLNGTLNIDLLTAQRKKEWSFTFEVDERGLQRLRNLWVLNHTFILIDWDGSQYTVACTSQNFDENFIGEDNGVCWFNLTLEFKEV